MNQRTDFPTNRREFLKATSAIAGAGLAGLTIPSIQPWADEPAKEPMFKISLAEWSLHRMIQAGELKNIDFPEFTKNEFGIDAVEYVSIFFKEKANDLAYMKELKARGDDNGVEHVLIMVDAEGNLGDPDKSARTQAIENHHRWVEAAKYLGCHSIRVNARSEGTYEEQRDLAADGLRKLAEFGDEHKIGVIVENHGGLSSNGKWLAEVMQQVDHPNCGTLPDFGNFAIRRAKGDDPGEYYDRYQGVTDLMPFAKAVSAKSHVFDAGGNEAETDYFRMMAIVMAAGYHGYVGIEWEGSEPNEMEGIRLTKQLLERVRNELA